jgi:hypothetical protein
MSQPHAAVGQRSAIQLADLMRHSIRPNQLKVSAQQVAVARATRGRTGRLASDFFRVGGRSDELLCSTVSGGARPDSRAAVSMKLNENMKTHLFSDRESHRRLESAPVSRRLSSGVPAQQVRGSDFVISTLFPSNCQARSLARFRPTSGGNRPPNSDQNCSPDCSPARCSARPLSGQQFMLIYVTLAQ